MQWFTNYATNTWPGGTWNRKAMSGIGNGVDSDPNRQLGYGFKYLEFEALNGGWIDANVNPPAAPVLDFPSKPVLTATGDGAFPVTDLTFESSGFADPQGAGDFAAWQWRVARISAAGMPGHDAAGPSIYEMNAVMESGELSGAPGEFAIPLGVVEPGLTYRVRVRHKDVAGNWSYWSEPVEFGATAAPQRDLVHYWNFNSVPVLGVSYTAGGADLTVSGTGTVLSDSGQSFTGENAWNGDLTGTHFRLNEPLGATVDLAVPTTGYREVIVRYETRRSGQGAGLQVVSYTVDGTNYLPFAEIEVLDGVPVVQNLDFRGVSGVDHNPDFAIRITFQQGSGGLAGNNRFDNLTVEGEALPAAAVTLDGLAVIYDGAEKEVLVTTDPPGLAVEITYNGSPTVPVAAGSYAVVATVNDENFVGSASGTLEIAKRAAVVTLGDLVAVYDGLEKEVSVTTDPLGLAVEVTYDGLSTIPTEVGSYAVVATVVDDNHEGSASGVLEIEAAVAGYADWRTEHFPDPGDLANDAISGPFASAAGDGVANIVRYSMDLGPFDGVGGKMPKIAMTPGGPVLLFHHDAAKEDLRWLVKTSPDLVDWTTVTWDSEVHGAPGAHGDPWFNASIALPETFGGNPATELFHRLEIGVAAEN